jgi:hypothetical protein
MGRLWKFEKDEVDEWVEQDAQKVREKSDGRTPF